MINKSFADRESAPRFSFGSSNREKNYLGLSKFKLANIPGPGSYKIPVHVAKTAYYDSGKRTIATHMHEI